MIFYAIATIRTETGNFSPSEEKASALSAGRDQRPFGKYDQVRVKKDGKPDIRFYNDKTLLLTDSGLGNRAHVKGTYLDPDVSVEVYRA